MPYVDIGGRQLAIAALESWCLKQYRNPIKDLSVGQMNFLISSMVRDWMPRNDDGSLHYAGCNATVGLLECVKSEFYRRVVVPYESSKMRQNGDIYG